MQGKSNDHIVCTLIDQLVLINLSEDCGAGVAVGGGWQALVAYINLACYYIFGLPLGYLLGYVADLGVVVINFELLWRELKRVMQFLEGDI